MTTIRYSREACIIVPHTMGDENMKERARLTELLVRAFGGITISDSYGIWQDPDGAFIREPVQQFVFACSEDISNNTITSIAAEACIRFKQDAIYVRYPDGTVDIIAKGRAKVLCE